MNTIEPTPTVCARAHSVLVYLTVRPLDKGFTREPREPESARAAGLPEGDGNGMRRSTLRFRQGACAKRLNCFRATIWFTPTKAGPGLTLGAVDGR